MTKKKDSEDLTAKLTVGAVEEICADIAVAKRTAEAVDGQLKSFGVATEENLNRLAQSIIDLQSQIEALQSSDRMSKELIRRLQDTIADKTVEIAQLSDRLDNLTPKPSLFTRFKNELARRFGK